MTLYNDRPVNMEKYNKWYEEQGLSKIFPIWAIREKQAAYAIEALEMLYEEFISDLERIPKGEAQDMVFYLKNKIFTILQELDDFNNIMTESINSGEIGGNIPPLPPKRSL